MNKEGDAPHDAHVLVVLYPIQGHINPLLQFSKRLHSKGLRITLAIPRSILNHLHPQTGTIRVETFSDGFDDGYWKTESLEEYYKSLKKVGSQTLTELIKKQQSSGDPISCVVYDAFLPWALDVAKGYNLIGAAFFTQSCAVSSIYYNVQRGLLTVPDVAGSIICVAGLPELKITDLPSFFSSYGSYPSVLTLLTSQFSNIDEADWVLFNSFDKLEQEEMNWMSKLWRVKTIGPTMPSTYLDKRIEGDEDYGLNLFNPIPDLCINWLNKRETGSVVYVSFGSVAELGDDQMKELAFYLKDSNIYFLWVVRQAEEKKLPSNFLEETLEKGLVVTWCPQLKVLSHKAIGCFVTHCGWNSTLESLSLGVPMVGLPQWTDQPTNAKYIEDVWGVGLRIKVDEKGFAAREEIETCIMEIMEGERGKVMKKNAIKWKELAKEAVDEGGSSDKNIEEFATLKCDNAP